MKGSASVDVLNKISIQNIADEIVADFCEVYNEEELLVCCYRNSLELAIKYDINSIAFPIISIGVYRFPKELAAKVAVREINVGDIDGT